MHNELVPLMLLCRKEYLQMPSCVYATEAVDVSYWHIKD